MLRINQQKNAAAAKSYYSSPAEYYRPGEQEIVGLWGGKAADRLDLAGDVIRQQFERLCDNLGFFAYPRENHQSKKTLRNLRMLEMGAIAEQRNLRLRALKRQNRISLKFCDMAVTVDFRRSPCRKL